MALALVLAGCAAQGGVDAPPAAGVPLRVTNEGRPYANYEGAAARKQANATCAAQGKRLEPTLYDRYEAGAWVYVRGCV